MIVEDRKRKKYGKATGILSLILAGDVLAMVITSRNVIQSLGSLSNGLVAGNTFVLLDVLGAAFAVLLGFLLLKFKHFNKASFAITCGFGIFFGLTLPLMEIYHLDGSYLSVAMVEGALALVLAVIVMVLSLLF